MNDLNLKIKIGSDSKQAEASVGRVNAALKGLETSSQKLNGMLSGMGVALSVSGFAAFVKSGIDAADALNDLADRSGIAIEKLAGLEYAVKIGDTSMESFIGASNKLSINISKNAEDFAKLGITAKEPVDAFKQLADVFSSTEDPQQRAAVGAAALGKSYAEMAPLLMMGAKGIQELIDTGREHNPVTAEQARLAGEFNDKLGELSNRSVGFRSKLSTGVLEPLVFIGEAIDKNVEKFGIFEGVLKGFMNGYENFALSGTGGGLSKELDEINVKIAEQKTLLADIRTGETPGGAQREIKVYKELNGLISQRADMLKKISDDRKSAPPPKPVNGLVFGDGTGGDTGESELQKQAEALQKSYDSMVSSLKKEIVLRGDNTAAAAMEYEVQFGAMAKLDDAQKVKLLNLAAEKDYINNLTDSYKDYEDIIDQGNQLAKRQRDDISADFERLSQLFSGENQAMYGQFDDAFRAKGLGIINDQELARSLENISLGFDAITGKAQESTDHMSEFSIQAARNMQTAFADFLFDPFQNGLDGMLDGFLTTIRRMAANEASSQLMEGLFGKSGGGDSGGLLGPLFGAVKSGLMGMFGGGLNADIDGLIGNSALFANGGIMTGAGPVPLRKYAGGGIANSPQLAMFGEGSTPEAYVPLPDGRRIPVAMENGGGKQVNITLNIQTPNADSFRKSERQIRDQMLRAVNV